VAIGIWSVLKAAATKIPWTRVVQSAPVVVEALDRMKARVRLNEAAQKNLDDQLKYLVEENVRLSGELKQASFRLQKLTARVSLLTKLVLVSFLCAVAALAVALFA